MRSKLFVIFAAISCASGLSAAAGDAARDGKCLVFNLPAMKSGEVRKLLDLVPLMTLGGSLVNAGSASHPVMCFEYDDDEHARDVRGQLTDVYDAKDVAAAAQSAKSCDDTED